VNVVRLLVLGTLSRQGPMHGHQIRRMIETINLEAWSEVRVGSLYHALHQLEAEELIRAVSSEQRGRMPRRTTYAITEQGEQELAMLRDRGLREARLRLTDPFDVALWVAVDVPTEELAAIVGQRVDTIAVQLRAIAQERRQLTAKGVLPAVGELLMRHGEERLEAEIRWHRELLSVLPRLREAPPVLPGGAQD
jgi:DNA-binding PadR family transcriptional regulator